ncbi:MAG TPA: ROK family protein [Candidatus Acidoferrum sp.]|nr:ROK family protein [Candidatus Acidoferrum sp.]
MKSSAPFSIGIDLGGTNIKLVAVTQDSSVLKRAQRPTQDLPDNLGVWVEIIRQTIAQMESGQGRRASYIGLATPGVIEPGSRHVAWCPGKLNGIEGFNWTLALNRRPAVPLLNDAHAALLGEHWLGAAKEFESVILLTLGTGVGGAILENGRLLRGSHGWAGALGQTSLDPRGGKSFYTVPGALENWIGNQTVSRRSRGRFHDTGDLVAATRAGDLEAQKIWHKSIRALAVAIASFKMILDPEAVIIGGGISRAGPLLFQPLAAELDQVEWRPGGRRMKILPARLGEWAGAIGAARNAMLCGRKPKKRPGRNG